MRSEIIRAPRGLRAGDFFVKSGHVGLAGHDAAYLDDVKVTWGGTYVVESAQPFDGEASLIDGIFVPTPEGAEVHGSAVSRGTSIQITLLEKAE